MYTVLLVGTVPQLLAHRKQAFEIAGYRVSVADSVVGALQMAADPGCDAVVIGLEITESERTRLARMLKANTPSLRIIYLYLGSIRNAEVADAVMQVTSDTSDLVHAVDLLVAPPVEGRPSTR